MLFSGILIRFGPDCYRYMFPPQPQLPSQYYIGNPQRFRTEPEFNLNKEAQALRDARLQATTVGDSTETPDQYP